MGKFIDWLFERGDTETAEERIFKNTSNEESNGHVIDFQIPKEIEECFVVKYAYIGSDKFEIEFNNRDIKEFNGDDRKEKQKIFDKYIGKAKQEIYMLGYESESFYHNYHAYYKNFWSSEKERLVATIEEFFNSNRIYKSKTEKISENILGIDYELERKRNYGTYSYHLDDFVAGFSQKYPLRFTNEESTVCDIISETDYVLTQLTERLKNTHKLQEYVINNSLSKFKIKIKEQTDDIAVDILKIDVMSLIKEDFYQYSHTVYIEKKRLYELIKNDSTFEEILEVK